MSAESHARLRVSIHGPDGSVRAIMTGTRKTIEANTPPGGCWREVPAGCASPAEAPALGEMAVVAKSGGGPVDTGTF